MKSVQHSVPDEIPSPCFHPQASQFRPSLISPIQYNGFETKPNITVMVHSLNLLPAFSQQLHILQLSFEPSLQHSTKQILLSFCVYMSLLYFILSIQWTKTISLVYQIAQKRYLTLSILYRIRAQLFYQLSDSLRTLFEKSDFFYYSINYPQTM